MPPALIAGVVSRRRGPGESEQPRALPSRGFSVFRRLPQTTGHRGLSCVAAFRVLLRTIEISARIGIKSPYFGLRRWQIGFSEALEMVRGTIRIKDKVRPDVG